jgi:hypothetical protein
MLKRATVDNADSIYNGKTGTVVDEETNAVAVKLDAGRLVWFFRDEVDITNIEEEIVKLQAKKAEIMAAIANDDKRSRAARAKLQAEKERLERELDDLTKGKAKE